MQNVKSPTVSTAAPLRSIAAPANRVAYLDNLRVFLTILVIVLHASVTYGSEGGWYYKEATNDLAVIIPLTVLSAVLQSFFMGLFFFMSGLFTPGSVDRKGPGNFVWDRVLRLGIPCLIFAYAINPISNFIVDGLILKIDLLYAAHIGTMWFAQALLVMGVLYALMRTVVPSLQTTDKPAPFPTTRQIVLLVAMMAALTFGVRYFYPRGTGRWGMIFGDFPQYITMFILGVIAYRKKWLDAIDTIKTRWLVITLVILIFLLPVMMLLGEDPVYGYEFFMGGLHWQAAAYATWESCMVVVVSLLLFHIFSRKFHTQNEVLANMSSSAYTVYIIHPLILVSGSVLLLDLTIYPLLKFVILVIFGTVTSFVLASLIKRIPGTGKIL